MTTTWWTLVRASLWAENNESTNEIINLMMTMMMNLRDPQQQVPKETHEEAGESQEQTWTDQLQCMTSLGRRIRDERESLTDLKQVNLPSRRKNLRKLSTLVFQLLLTRWKGSCLRHETSLPLWADRKESTPSRTRDDIYKRLRRSICPCLRIPWSKPWLTWRRRPREEYWPQNNNKYDEFSKN